MTKIFNFAICLCGSLLTMLPVNAFASDVSSKLYTEFLRQPDDVQKAVQILELCYEDEDCPTLENQNLEFKRAFSCEYALERVAGDDKERREKGKRAFLELVTIGEDTDWTGLSTPPSFDERPDIWSTLHPIYYDQDALRFLAASQHFKNSYNGLLERSDLVGFMSLLVLEQVVFCSTTTYKNGEYFEESILSDFSQEFTEDFRVTLLDLGVRLWEARNR